MNPYHVLFYKFYCYNLMKPIHTQFRKLQTLFPYIFNIGHDYKLYKITLTKACYTVYKCIVKTPTLYIYVDRQLVNIVVNLCKLKDPYWVIFC